MSDLSEFVKEKRESKGLSVRGLAIKASSSASYISRLENDLLGSKIKVETLNKIAFGLNVSRNEIYKAAGYVNVKDDIDLKELIDSGKYITFNGTEITEEDKILIKRLFRNY